jgi:hypothetical protein|uniref:HTH HARE-type domain-containing protein n=1 Tax=candidate division WOR-3 bacterium TaxID=2052148 RepID=A0A7C3UQ57_UNCW3
MKTAKAIYDVLEREVKLQILKEQAKRLQKELQTVEGAIAKLEGRKLTPTAKRTKAPTRKRTGKSLRVLAIEVLKRAKRPLHIKEILEKVEKKGFRSTAKSPKDVLYNLLIQRKDTFQRVGEATFALVK